MKTPDDPKSTLRSEFVAACVNLASKSITNWGAWAQYDGFPATGTWQEKLLFIDKTLEQSLGPVQHRPNARMFWRVRPGLNKYRGWLLHKVLHHALATQNGTPNSTFILPEDLPKLVEDLYLFHKHQKSISRDNNANVGTLQHYKSLEALREAVAPYEALYPLTAQEKICAHDAFVSECGGNGEAEIVATLKDGSELIHVMSERASIAYGSPRWCTAYRDKPTYFSHYADDLLTLIDPDGQRWQFHFREGHFRDEKDKEIKDFATFINDREELARALVPYLENNFDSVDVSERHALRTVKLLFSINVFRRQLMQDTRASTKFLSFISDESDDSFFLDVAASAKLYDDLRAFLTPHFFGKMEQFLSQEKESFERRKHRSFSLFNQETMVSFYNIMMSSPDWREQGLARGVNKKVLSLLDQEFHSIVFCSDSDDGPTRAKKYIKLCCFVSTVPEWRQHAEKQGCFSKAITDGFLADVFDTYEQDAKDNRFLGYTPKAYLASFWPTVLALPEWRAHALENSRLGRMLDILFEGIRPNQKRSLGHFISRDEGNDPAKTFMFMMPLFYNREGFREQMTLYVNHALALGRGKSAFFKARGRGGRPAVSLTVEILKYAKLVKAWRNSVLSEHVEKALQDDGAVVGVVDLAKNGAVSAWRQAVIASPRIPEILAEGERSTSAKKIRYALSRSTAYQKAFGIT